ncbi:hypothetical protein CPC08DRAFT_114143 [Agrocybe pediades]|nr:hypothetical protein CPC08DRAFT_114143 [Agrocybe pediades]
MGGTFLCPPACILASALIDIILKPCCQHLLNFFKIISPTSKPSEVSDDCPRRTPIFRWRKRLLKRSTVLDIVRDSRKWPRA